MPNIKSAIKRVNVIETKTLKNNIVKSKYRTDIKKFEKAISENSTDAKTLFITATRSIDQACSKGVIKKNTASRYKSRLSKMLNTISA